MACLVLKLAVQLTHLPNLALATVKMLLRKVENWPNMLNQEWILHSFDQIQNFKSVMLIVIQLNEATCEMARRQEKKSYEYRHIVEVIDI